MDYARAIRLARARKGIQQQELAEAAGLDKSYISLLEKGKRSPSSEVLQKIAETLETPLPLLQLLAAENDDLMVWDEPAVMKLSRDLLELIAGVRDGGE